MLEQLVLLFFLLKPFGKPHSVLGIARAGLIFSYEFPIGFALDVNSFSNTFQHKNHLTFN